MGRQALAYPQWEESMIRHTIPGFSVHPGLWLGMTLCLLTFIASPDPAQGQSARFDEFAQTSPKAGEMAPDFSLLTVDNEPFNLLEAAADMPVVIEFGSFT